ncbi:hypothetical protein H2201_000075 [Coniosporium apollinis]|uniref:Extracellular mutant protein 11 C-terminal domain-containing protein n=1 Tax=Coniosporium apollinis TaxID=61459 RepID=A0ABQ9P545_9PEZI|nr:hypothetical protein H2201_000075 [Coniosporium apollinis]
MAPPPRPVVVKREHVEVTVYNGDAPGDGFDTDLEGYDENTTISEVQVEGSQVEPYQNEGQENEDEGEESGSEEDEEGAVEGYDQNPAVPQNMQGVMAFFGQHMHAAQQGGVNTGHFNPFAPQNVFEAHNNSYPTTTSGRLDDEETVNGADQVVQVSSDTNAEEEEISPSPPTQQQPQIRRPVAVQQAFPTNAHIRQPQQPPSSLMQPPVFQQAAALRQQTRSQPTIPVRGVPAQAAATRPQTSLASARDASQPPASQPPTYSQVQRESQQHVHFTPPPAERLTPAPSTGEQAGPQNGNGDAAQLQQHEAQPIATQQEQEGPPFDYDTPALYGMAYADLQAESFDYNPRAPDPVLPPEKAAAPLPERLTHAHSQLAPPQQQQFFASLNIDEWEDAGDWFLEQFGGLIKKMKELRREKRKLAGKLEDEVAERDDQIMRKKQRLYGEMEGMRSQGQGLLKTPTKKR